MKVPAARIDRFVRNPDPEVGLVLVYGPDAGLVRERADALTRSIVDDPGDPFRLVRLTGAEIADDPARLHDEANTVAFGGGRKVVRIDLTRTSKSPLIGIKAYAAEPSPEALVIAEAGEFAARDALRRLFEESPRAAALPCYADDDRNLAAVIRESLDEHGARASADALSFLSAHLGSDRLVTRCELEKLALFAADRDAAAGEISLEDAVASVGDSSVLTLDDLVYAAAGGDQAKLDKSLARLAQEGVNPITVLRAAARHFQRLHLVAGQTGRGVATELAMKRLRPSVFWKQETAFKAQIRMWKVHDLAAILGRLLEAELACKRTGAPAQALCSEVLHGIATQAHAGAP